MWKNININYLFPSYYCNIYFNNFIYIFGGIINNKYSNKFIKINLSNFNIIELSDCNGIYPCKRYKHCCCLYKNKMIIHGGKDNYSYLNDLYIYDIYNNNWEIILDDGDIPCNRCEHKINEYNGMIYLFGGYNGKEYLNDLYILSLKTYKWRKILTNNSIPKISNYDSIIIKNKLLIYGGISYNNKINNKILIFDILNENWKIIKNELIIPLYNHIIFYNFNNLYIYGGKSIKYNNNKIYKYEIDINKEELIINRFEINNNNNNIIRIGNNGILYKNKIIIIGGNDILNNNINEIEIFNILKYETNKIKEEEINPLYKLKMKELINNEKYSDIKIECKNNKIIYCHKIILENQSEYFKGLFNSKMIESNKSILKYNDIEYNDFIKILEYIYTGDILNKNDYNIELLILSNRFSIINLEKLCYYYLCDNINENNVCKTFLYSNKYNFKLIEEYCLNYIFKNIDKICKNKDFELLGEYPELLIEITKKNILNE